MIEPVGPDETSRETSFSVRLVWFSGIAIASGLAVACVAYALRGLLFM